MSIRTILLASQAVGVSRISNLLESEDVFSTIDSLKKLNCKIKKIGKKKYQVYGKGVDKKFVKIIHKSILGNVKPDLTFLLNVNINYMVPFLKKLTSYLLI